MAKINEYIDIAAYKNTLKCLNKDLFTSGNVRVNKLRISLDSWWDNLSKWFCFRVRDNVCYADEIENIGSDVIVTIPSGIFAKENIGNTCFFGIYGSKGEKPDIALSTEWYNLGKIEEGVYATNTLIAEADSFLAAVDAKINSAAQSAVNYAELSLNEDYVLTLTAKNGKGEILSSSFVDLPIEELVKDGRYDEENKEIVLILEDGKEIRVPVGDLVENKVDKTAELNKVYGTQENGYQYLYNISKNADPHSIVQRTEFGTIKAEYPRDDSDIATQGSVNTGLSKKLNRVNKESDYLSVYAVTDTGGDAFLKQRSDEALTWSVPLRFRQGQILAARSDIEKDPEKLKDSKGNPIDTDNFLVTQGQLKEVETKVNNRIQKTNSTYILYGTTGKDGAGNTTQSELPFRTTVSNNSIAQRTGTGQLKAATPVEKEDLTTKAYVDSAVPDLGNFAFDTNTLKNENASAEVVLGNAIGMPDTTTISQQGILRQDVVHQNTGSWGILDGIVHAYSSDATPERKETSLFNIINSSEKTNVIDDSYGAIIKSDKLGLVNTFEGEAATLTITKLEVLSNGETKSETLKNIIDAPSKLELISTDVNDSTNTYYPGKEDKEVFKTARNTISGSESIVGSKGFAINEDNFHYGCLGLFVIKPYLDFVPRTGMKMVCARWTASQEFTIRDVKEFDYEETVNIDGAQQVLIRRHYTILTEEVPYLYSNDVYSFTKIEFFNGDTLIGKLEPTANEVADFIQWYGCVTTWSKDNITTPTIDDYIESKDNYYMPKEGNIGAFYYVDIPIGVITETLTDEPTCIKIDANYDSGTKQSYIDAKELLKNSGAPADIINSVSDSCLKANYNPANDYLTLSLKRHINKGWGLSQKPIFSEASCIRFTDRPDLGNVVVGAGFNNVNGKQNKAIFDYGFASGKNNISIGRYAVAQGTRNASVYGGIALGNHNTVLGQNGFAVGATNYIDSDGSNSITAGSENASLANCGIAMGRRNTVYSIYGAGIGYGNKIKGKSSSALGYTNSLNDDSEFAAGTGNTLSGENAVAIGRANQSYGKSNTCIGYGNIVNNCVCGTAIGNVNHVYANYAFAAGNNNTVNADASGVIGLNLNVKVSSESGIYDNVGHLLVGSNNTINGGRNLIMGGQSNIALLHDSIVIGNNLKETSKGFGKAIFGNYNIESDASIVLGAGYTDSSTGNIIRRNAFEVYSDGKGVFTPFATAYSSTDTKRLTTKEYVDTAIATAAILVSPNGTKYKISVNDDGSLTTNKINN